MPKAIFLREFTRRYQTPYISTVLMGLVIAMAAGTLPPQLLGQLVSIGTLLAFVLACISVLVLRRTSPEAPRPFRTPVLPWVPVIGALLCFIQMLGLPWATWERLFIWLAIGGVVYLASGRRHSRLARGRSS